MNPIELVIVATVLVSALCYLVRGALDKFHQRSSVSCTGCGCAKAKLVRPPAPANRILLPSEQND